MLSLISSSRSSDRVQRRKPHDVYNVRDVESADRHQRCSNWISAYVNR